MAHQEASITVAVPLAEVEARLADVETWPQFLAGVVQVRQTGYQRYRLAIRNDTRQRVVDVVIAAHPHEHRFTWQALSGPRYQGELRLHEVDPLQTRVDVSATADPAGFLSGMAEMLGSSGTATLVDLYQLIDHVSAAPPSGPAGPTSSTTAPIAEPQP